MASGKTAALAGLPMRKRKPVHPALEPVPAGQGSGYYKALTLKVDKARFTKLKNLGVEKDRRSQALMTEALDLLFAKHHL